jgi:hypothetical protein
MNVITKPKILKAVRLMPQKEIELEVTYVGSRENAPY